MTSFHDSRDRAWNIVVDVPTIRRVRSSLQVDLGGVLDGDLLRRLGDDPVLLVDLLWVLVQPQAEAQNVSDEDFGRALAGDAIDRATKAFLDALVAFFPAQKRRLLEHALAKLRKLEAAAVEHGVKAFDSGFLDRKLEAALQSVYADAAAPAAD